MQLTGTQLTNTSALAGNDVATFPDFPAEIRAPRGTRAGVSGFQVQFASEDIFTPGDQLDTLVVMNPAALVTNISDLRSGGLLIVNEDNFVDKEFRLAKLESNPLDDPDLDQYRLIKIKMTLLTRTAVEELELSTKIADRCKNFFAMGLCTGYIIETCNQHSISLMPSSVGNLRLPRPMKRHLGLGTTTAKQPKLQSVLTKSKKLSLSLADTKTLWEIRR